MVSIEALAERDVLDILHALRLDRRTAYSNGIHYGRYAIFHGGMTEAFVFLVNQDTRAGVVFRAGDCAWAYFRLDVDPSWTDAFQAWYVASMPSIWPDVRSIRTLPGSAGIEGIVRSCDA